MHDIRFIRNNPDAFDNALARRNLPAHAAEILKLDEQHRKVITDLQELQSHRNQLAKEYAIAKKNGQDVSDLATQSSALGDKMTELSHLEAELGNQLKHELAHIPNLPAIDCPDGKDETDNVEVRAFGEHPQFKFTPLQHFEIGEKLGLMDFETATKIAGSRFVVLKGALARMERALGAFMLDIHTNEFGYEETYIPHLVNDTTLYGVGHLPKFAHDMFHATSGLWMISTSEAPLTNLVANEILDEASLPLRFTAFSSCYRSEAGSAGRDTRGMIRQHQFSKVELVSITTPEQAVAEHERMTRAAETILERLGLPYRTLTLCTGDMGFSSEKTYDIEVWLPGQNAYREISSCSRCSDFQARRMHARYKSTTDGKNHFVHTLNGSGLAVGRTMVAILENYQQEDGSVLIPKALLPYMGGIERLTVKKNHTHGH